MGYGSHTPQNQPKYVVRIREREVTTWPVWNRRDGAHTGRRRVTAWSKWRTIAAYRHEDDAKARHALSKRANSLADVGLFFAGKRVDR